MGIEMKRKNPTRYSHELSVKLPLELIADFNKLRFQFNGVVGTVATQVLTQLLKRDQKLMDQIRTYPARPMDSIQHPTQNSTIGYESRDLDGSKPMALSQAKPEDLCLRLLEKYTSLVDSYEINSGLDLGLLKN
jgi:hypothetical protein